MVKVIETVGLIVIKENTLLLTFSKNKRAWYLPGGKIEIGETKEQALIREIEEELSIKLKKERLKYYYHISTPAYGEENTIMEQDCFIYELVEKILPNNEIEKFKFFKYEEYLEEQAQVIGVLEAYRKLKEDKLIKLS